PLDGFDDDPIPGVAAVDGHFPLFLGFFQTTDVMAEAPVVSCALRSSSDSLRSRATWYLTADSLPCDTSRGSKMTPLRANTLSTCTTGKSRPSATSSTIISRGR